MANIDQKSIGKILVASSFILIILLIFVKLNLDKEGAFLCKVVAESPTLTMEQCPAHENIASWYVLAAFVIALLIFGSGIFMIFKPIKKEIAEIREISAKKKKEAGTTESISKAEKADISKISKFDEREKKVYELLVQKDGSMYQSDIMKETGLTKVQLTRILDRMEGKKLIERQRRGMTNIVILN